MNIFILDSYEDLSRQAADTLISVVKDQKQPLLCVASGDSPAGLYRELVNRVTRKELNIADWFFVGLDEWCGMNGKDEGSCRYHLDRQLFQPLQIKEEQICFFDGRARDPVAECQRIEAFISARNGIDIAIVGLGMNGHVGMNEPGTPPNTRAHVAALDEMTKQVGQKYFQQETVLTSGLTLGLADLLAARNVFLLANGARKAGIVSRALHEPVSEQLPVSLLRRHSGFSVYLDKAAAAKLHNTPTGKAGLSKANE